MTEPFLDTLALAASQSAKAEADIRREWVERVKALERERAFAHRRLNFMRAIAEAVAATQSEEIAVAAATAAMRAKLGWWDEDEVRAEVLSRFVPVTQQIFADRAPSCCTGATGRPPVPHTGDKINQINAVSGYYTILT